MHLIIDLHVLLPWKGGLYQRVGIFWMWAFLNFRWEFIGDERQLETGFLLESTRYLGWHGKYLQTVTWTQTYTEQPRSTCFSIGWSRICKQTTHMETAVLASTHLWYRTLVCWCRGIWSRYYLIHIIKYLKKKNKYFFYIIHIIKYSLWSTC